ncbi:hypothetical protein RQP46_002604 [Phenoliferia psychrophenolica]
MNDGGPGGSGTTSVARSESLPRVALALDHATPPESGAELSSPKPLPNELILAIIRAGLPPVRDSTFGERSSLLLTWSLVSRAWAALAQSELYRHVSLPSLRAIVRYLPHQNTPETNDPRKARFRHTQTLRFGKAASFRGGPPNPTARLDKVLGLVLALCTQLKELRITAMYGVDYAELSIAAGLVSLHLDDVDFRPRDRNRLYLPKLKAISLNSIICHTPTGEPSETDDFLNPTSLPALTHLAWRYYPSILGEDLPSPSFHLIAPQIESLFLGRHMSQEYYDAFMESLPSATNLQHLTLDSPELLGDYVAVIASRLRSLQIGMHFFRSRPLPVHQEVLPVLQDWPRSLEHLEKLSLPEVFFYGWTRRLRDKLDKSIPEVKEAWKARDAVATLCSAREVELVERPLTEDGEDFEGSLAPPHVAPSLGACAIDIRIPASRSDCDPIRLDVDPAPAAVDLAAPTAPHTSPPTPTRSPNGGQRLLAGGYSYPGFGVLGAGTSAGSRPGSGGYGSAGGAGRNRVASGSIGGGGTAPQGHGQSREWSFFGVEIPIANVSALAHDPPPVSPTSLDRDPRRPPSSLTNQEIFSTSFGGDRWKLEILKPTQGETDKLSLYLSCQILDTAFSPDIIPTTLMFGIRESKEQIGRREAREGWVWQVWEAEWSFRTGNEYYECHSFPSFDDLLRNPRIAQLDSFILSIQISSPVQATFPQLQHSHHIPRDLLLGVQNLIDDRSTSDVLIYCHERQPTLDLMEGQEDNGEHLYRKRAIYVHGTILRARSSYFEDMLSSDWAETSSEEARSRSIVKIEDFDFVTVYWLVHYLYTNEISFQQTEDVRLLPPDELPLGWLSTPSTIPWTWFPISLLTPPPISLSTTSTHSTSSPTALSDIPESDSPPPGLAGLSPKAAGKRRSVPPPPAPKKASLTDEPNSPTRVSPQAAGRISPLGGRISPSTSRGGVGARKYSANGKEEDRAVPLIEEVLAVNVEEEGRTEDKDPHAHPAVVVTPASALAMYRIAHRYGLQDLASLALCHIISTLTPRTAFPLLLSTHLWPDLHAAIKGYALANFEAVVREPEFSRCYAEVGEGLWEHGGEVLLDWTLQLQPAWRGTLA